jgi:hypothetical protein
MAHVNGDNPEVINIINREDDWQLRLRKIQDDQRANLGAVLKKYAVPDPAIVSKLPKGGIQLDFVGHADITRILIEIDPLWDWSPVEFDTDGLPKYRVENGMAHMAGTLTIHGVSRIGIGSAPHNKQDLLKELASDFLRNAAMRFGIALNLWTKNEWEDLGGRPAPGQGKPAPASKPQDKTLSKPKDQTNVHQMPTKETSKPKHPSNQPTDVQIKFIEKLAKQFGDPIDVCGDIIDRIIESISDLTVDEMKVINTNLKERKAE